MAARKDDEIMAEYLLKGGKMLEKTCPACGCPMFEYRKKTFCVVCAEKNAAEAPAKNAKAKAAAAPAAAAAPSHDHDHDAACTCGGDHDGEPCGEGEGNMLAEEIALTMHALCERVNTEKDPNHILTLMTAVKTGAEALEILCRL